MNVDNIDPTYIETNIKRNNTRSVVTVEFDDDNITITASMSCDNNLDSEDDSRRQIMNYLGFSKKFIASLYND